MITLAENTPRGVRDFSPAEAISLRYISGVAEEVFKRFGFYPLETPAIESMSVLNAKAYGDESAKEIFSLEGGESGLRYDFTVPLARYVAANKDLVLPFKRYQIGAMWRKEEPQKMRYREALQADIDIVGSEEVESDAEVVAAAALAIEELGIRSYSVMLNSRQILTQILTYFKIPADKQVAVLRVLDKMQKISRDEAVKQISDSGVATNTADELLNFISGEAKNEDKLQKIGANIEGAKEAVEKMQKLLSLLAEYKLNGNLNLELGLARGLNYYTGFIWEFVVEENGRRLPSIGGGGRYDNLIGMFAKRNVPATGSSLGISRIFDILDPQDGKKTYAKVYIAYIGDQNRGYAVTAANTLRGNGVYADMNTTSRNLSKQLEYAGALRISNVVIIGDKEREAGKVRLRNMDTGEEELISLQEAIQKLR